MSIKFPGMAGALSVLALLWSAHLSAAGLESRPAQAAPAFLAKDMAGQSHTLADYRGKVVLLNFWASWCPPCREEMPSLDRLNAKRRSATFEVVALSLDSPEKSQAFLRAIQAQTLRGYTDHQGGALRTLGLVSVPTTLLIDAKGREIGRTVGPAAWDGPAALNLIDSITKEPT